MGETSTKYAWTEMVQYLNIELEPFLRSTKLISKTTDKPHNPMLNGGAIMSCALILNNIEPRSGPAEKYEFVYKSLHKLGGESIT